MHSDVRETYLPLPIFVDDNLGEYTFEELTRISKAFGSIILPRGWHEIAATDEAVFQNSWGNVGGLYETLAYRLLANNSIVMKGLGLAGTLTDGTTIFTFPEGYRPRVEVVLSTIGRRVNGTSEGSVYLHILQNGNVNIYGANVNVAQVSFTGSFFLDN